MERSRLNTNDGDRENFIGLLRLLTITLVCDSAQKPLQSSSFTYQYVALVEKLILSTFLKRGELLILPPAQIKEKNTRWKIKPWPLYGLMLRHSLQQVVMVHHIEAFLIIWYGHTGDDKRIRLGHPKWLSLLVHRNQRTLGGPLFKCSVHPLPTSSTNLQDISITNEQEHNLENPCENSETTLLVILQRNPYYLIGCSSHATKRAQNSKVPKPEQQRETLVGG